MKQNKTILVIAPHADDEVLGCAGYLLHEIEQGARVHVLFATIGGEDRRQDLDSRVAETNRVAAAMGYDYEVICYGKDARLDTVPSFDIISAIDRTIAQLEPDEVFVNYPSSHQDHIKLFQCAKAAMRLKEGYMPPLWALYEYPFITGTDKLDGGLMYVDISDNIDRKVELFGLYGSQVKQAPSPLNETGIRKLAAMRGLECGCEYAERYYVQQIVKR